MNRTRILMIPALLATALMSSVAKADQFDYLIANILLLQEKPVQKELGVTEAQRAKLNGHADWMNGKMAALDKQYTEQRKKNANAKAPTAEVTKLQRDFKQRLMGELTANQVVRLREVTIQVAGYPALFDDMIAKRLGLTSKQSTTLKTSWSKTAKKADALVEKAIGIQKKAAEPVIASFGKKAPKNDAEKKARQDKVNAAVAKVQPQVKKIEAEIDSLRASFASVVSKTLTAKQIADFKALQGRPFKG